jgi:hypothetical protein
MNPENIEIVKDGTKPFNCSFIEKSIILLKTNMRNKEYTTDTIAAESTT